MNRRTPAHATLVMGALGGRRTGLAFAALGVFGA
jgi:hypothetical protein